MGPLVAILHLKERGVLFTRRVELNAECQLESCFYMDRIPRLALVCYEGALSPNGKRQTAHSRGSVYVI